MAAYDRPVTPSTVARDRYQRCFASSIFDPPEEPKAPLAPAGKRRDQTVSEMFGDDQEGKNLKFQQGTFAPKGDPRSAREKKQDFLSSNVLPATSYEHGAEETVDDDPHRAFSIDPVARRLQENTSLIFNDGQEAAAVPDSEVHAKWAENKLRPTSFRWYQQLETAKTGPEEEDSAAVRALHEKRSTVLRNGAPDAVTSESEAVHARQEDELAERRIEQVADEKRRANCYYSDLFGRETPMDFAQAQGARHAKRVAPEDRITVHGDWSDARTELERPVSGHPDRTPAARKLEEFHKDHVFEGKDTPTANDPKFQPAPILVHCQAPDVMDNSKKVERHDHDTKVIHQSHMQSSVVDKQFYRDAASRTAWEVAEVHISGLKSSESNESIGHKIRAAGFHVIRVSAAMDPVNNTCKGTCRLQVRYNPDEQHHPVGELLRVLEEKYGLRGEM